jgi:hypothetical protein
MMLATGNQLAAYVHLKQNGSAVTGTEGHRMGVLVVAGPVGWRGA